MSKIIIYQVFTRLFGQRKRVNIPGGSIEENGCGKFNHITTRALQEIKALGPTHVWFTGVIEHATCTVYKELPGEEDFPKLVKGRAGSPYAIRDYYNVDPDLADSVVDRMAEFEKMLRRTHRVGLKAIIDFVPNHVARSYRSEHTPEAVRNFGDDDDTSLAFAPNNNFYYLPGTTFAPQFELGEYRESPARVTGNDCFSAHPSINDWYETVKLNYGVDYLDRHKTYFTPTPDTWLKMRDILLFWAAKGVDGFRCDMAEMVPTAFWTWVIAELKRQYPAVLFIGEIYQPGLYHSYVAAGFDYLYDKVGFYDTLRGVMTGQTAAAELTYAWQNAGELLPNMLYFLENHDEQRIASDYFLGSASKARPAVAVATLLQGNPMMIYAGQEFGERGMDAEGFSGRDGRTTIFDYWGVDTLCRWYNHGAYDQTLLLEREKASQNFYRKLFEVAKLPLFADGKFFDLMYYNFDNTSFDSFHHFAFLRAHKGDVAIVVANFGASRSRISINIPQHAFDYLGLIYRDACFALDLLSAHVVPTTFSADEPFVIDVEAQDVLVLKLT